MVLSDSDLLRTPKNLMQPDPRNKYISKYETVSGLTQEFTVEDFYGLVKDLSLNDSVPLDIRTQFETCKNLLLYSWFVYRFGTLAQLHAYSTLEYALKEKIKQAGMKVETSLSRLLDKAIQQGWLPQLTQERTKIIAIAIPKLRNELAHGSSTLLSPKDNQLFVQECANLINQLFPKN